MRFPFRPVLVMLCLLVAASAARAADLPGGGTIQMRAAPSPHLGKEIAYQLYLPPGYAPDGSIRYPVLYLLHGRGDNMTAWTTLKPDLDRLIREGSIPAVIAVMPDAPASRRAGYYIDSQFTGNTELPAGELTESGFTTDLIAHVDTTFPTKSHRNNRIIAGYSMGGYGALRYSLAHPELFGAAIVLSPAVYFPLPPMASSTREFGAFGRGARLFDDTRYTSLNYPAAIPAFTAQALPLVLFIAVGDDEQPLPNPQESAHDLDYEAHTLYNNIRRVPLVTAQLRVFDGGHGWDTWRPAFLEGIQYIFGRRKAAPTPTDARH